MRLLFVAGVVIIGSLGCSRPDLGVPPQVCSTQAVNAGESELMEPGGACINCHATYEGPSFALAGTVMSALHDDTNCGGVADVTVAITGDDGMRVELVSNANGNFRLDHWPGTKLFPYKAEVSRRCRRQDADAPGAGTRRLQRLPHRGRGQRRARADRRALSYGLPSAIPGAAGARWLFAPADEWRSACVVRGRNRPRGGAPFGTSIAVSLP